MPIFNIMIFKEKFKLLKNRTNKLTELVQTEACYFDKSEIIDLAKKIGTYENTVKADIDTLANAKIISVKQYWENHVNDIEYLPNLFASMAEYVRKNK